MDEHVDHIVTILEDDAFRAGGSISNDRLLLLAAKFQLSPENIIRVKQKLADRDVAIELGDEDELQRDQPSGETNETPAAEPDVAQLEKAHDIIATYFRESARYKLITRDEELALARRIRAGQDASLQLDACDASIHAALTALVNDGDAARDDLIQANLRFVPFVAKQVETFGNIAQEDLIQEGNLGLLRAADKFDGEHGARFSTYAYWWIWSFMTRAINDRSRLVRVPVHVVDRIPALLRAQRALSRERDGTPVMPQELADVLGWNLKTVQLVLYAHASESVSLDVGSNDDAPTLGDRLASPPEGRPDAMAARGEQRRLLNTLVASLGKRLAYVLTERFGLSNGIERTLEDIGNQLGVTRERIRQIEKKALDRLRHPSRTRLMREIFGLDRRRAVVAADEGQGDGDDDID